MVSITNTSFRFIRALIQHSLLSHLCLVLPYLPVYLHHTQSIDFVAYDCSSLLSCWSSWSDSFWPTSYIRFLILNFSGVKPYVVWAGESLGNYIYGMEFLNLSLPIRIQFPCVLHEKYEIKCMYFLLTTYIENSNKSYSNVPYFFYIPECCAVYFCWKCCTITCRNIRIQPFPF